MSGDCPTREPAALKALPALHVRFLADLRTHKRRASSLSYTASTYRQLGSSRTEGRSPPTDDQPTIEATRELVALEALATHLSLFPQSSGDPGEEALWLHCTTRTAKAAMIFVQAAQKKQSTKTANV